MTCQFRGTINIDVRDSVPDWEPYTQPNAPDGPGNFSLVGEGPAVGRYGGEPVTEDYPGTRPWRFTGGTITHVIVDVSGDQFIDIEREAVAMMARE